jgi:hypothetical protein
MVPAAMFIESGAASLLKMSEEVKKDHLAELHEFAPAGVAVLGVAGGLSHELQIGYLLGLETARAIIATDGILVQKAINPKDVL